MDDRALINKRFSTVKGDIRWHHWWPAATSNQSTRTIYKLGKYFVSIS